MYDERSVSELAFLEILNLCDFLLCEKGIYLTRKRVLVNLRNEYIPLELRSQRLL